MPGWGQEDKKTEKPRGPPSGWSGCWDGTERPAHEVNPSSIADLVKGRTPAGPVEDSKNPVYHKPEEKGPGYDGK
ncbi:MAG TPA: hypothetical protein VJC00_04480 [Candidatus Nanoarchaeia archaeon]|nr:hypothetical protein [Candidatus Nanoarchaeia archaeon]